MSIKTISPGEEEETERMDGDVPEPSKPTAKRAPKAKAKGKAVAKGAQDGMKCCADCGKMLPLSTFSPNQASCNAPCLPLQRNVRLACKAEGCLDYFEETRKNPKAWKQLRAYYLKTMGTTVACA